MMLENDPHLNAKVGKVFGQLEEMSQSSKMAFATFLVLMRSALNIVPFEERVRFGKLLCETISGLLEVAAKYKNVENN